MEGKWKFVPALRRGDNIGHLEMPNGHILGDIIPYLSSDGAETDEQIIQRVVDTLNRELPNGKRRSHHKPVHSRRAA